MKNITIKEERISAEEYIEFLKRTDLGVDRNYERQGIATKTDEAGSRTCRRRKRYRSLSYSKRKRHSILRETRNEARRRGYEI